MIETVKLELRDTHTFQEVQQAFNKAYPYLWIDFFCSRVNVTGKSAKPEKLKPEAALRQCGPFEGTKIISINSNRSVQELEYDFWNTLGIKTKVLRKLGPVWVATTLTGNWTLAVQNMEGEQLVHW